jgi:ectoine hydroxylase-related dioxygenase (phytanoyl-CoA dioxygenase family)
MELPPIVSYGHTLETGPDKLGTLLDSSSVVNDVEELKTRLERDGYLYIKGYLDKDKVTKAYDALVNKLKDQTGFKPEIARDCSEVQEVLYSGKLVEFYEKLYGEPIRHYDYTWLRVMGPGKGTNPHCDLPYMGRGTHRHMTCWVPYKKTSYKLGGLMVLEGSHKRMDLLENYVYRDVDSYCENRERDLEKVKKNEWTFSGTLSHNPVAIRNKFGGRWLVTEFEPGDFLTFGMFVVHASIDNQTESEIRISTDSRYQRASEPIDERWVGINPPAHGPNGKRGLIC